MIIRVQHLDKYVSVRNRTVRDKRLSYKATGLLVYLLSLPDDATVDRVGLARSKRDGQDSVMTGLRELAEAGYIEYRKVQDERGRWKTEATVREAPRRPGTGAGKTSNGNGETGAGKSRSRSLTFKDQRGAGGRSPSGPPAPPKYHCAACGAESEYMRADGTWLCDDHRALKAVGDGAV